MLRKLSNEITDCYAQAKTCVRKAAEATTDHERDSYLCLQQHWLALAGSYEFSERLGENTRRRVEFDRESASPPIAISAPNDDEAVAKADTQLVEPWHHAARAVCDVITGVSELADVLQGHPELRYDLADLEAAHRALGRIVAVVKQRAAR
jgi:hypothetical protein